MLQSNPGIILKFKIYLKLDMSVKRWGIVLEEIDTNSFKTEVSLQYYLCYASTKLVAENKLKEIITRMAKNRNYRATTYKSYIYGDYASYEMLPNIDFYWTPPPIQENTDDTN